MARNRTYRRYSYAKDEKQGMCIRYESSNDRDRVLARTPYFKRASEKYVNDFLSNGDYEWVGPFTYYGNTPLDGITFYHTTPVK